MNILTFDIEDWTIEKRLLGSRKEMFIEYDRILDDILSTLSEKGIYATFFCLGQLAEDFPDVIKKIHNCGHNIGCHSFSHVWLNKMSNKEVEEDTHRAISSIEQLIGEKVISYRAPAFSIGERNKDHLEILYKNGICIDSSIFPANRELGGFSSFDSEEPVIICTNESELKEFPISVKHSLGRKLAFSGGGYFRIYPECLIRKWIRTSNYVIFYFHIKDFVKSKVKFLGRGKYEEYFKEPGSYTNRLKRYIKDNIGFGDSLIKFKNLVTDIPMIDLQTASKTYKFEKKIALI